jgi:uncharacterized protein YtpQ (UPF0354 family)
MKLLPWRGRTSKSAFRDRMCAVLREKLPDATIAATGELDIRISGLTSQAQVDVWLGRAYSEFQQKPGEAEDIIQRFVQAALRTANHPPLELDRIVPTIKPHDWLSSQLSALADHAQTGGFDPWVEPYNAELSIVYAEYRDGIRYGSRSEFESLGVSAEVIRELALANLRRIIGAIAVTGEDGLYLLGAGGTLSASLILLDEVISDPRLDIIGKPVVAVSDRNSFWVVDDSSSAAVFDLADRVTSCYRSEQYPISSSLYYRSGEKWEPLDPAPVDDTHAIANLQVIDVHAIKKGGGSDLVVVVASPLGADARSIFRLFRKLDGYLETINASAYREECGPPTAETTSIIVRLHPRSEPAVENILRVVGGWAEARNASLRVEKITPVAIR